MLFDRPYSENELVNVIEEYVRSLLYHTVQPCLFISDYALSVAVNSLDIYKEEITTIQIDEAMAYRGYLHLEWQTFQYPYYVHRCPPIVGYHVATACPYKLCWEDLYRFQDMEQKGLCNIETTLKRQRLL